MNENVNLERNDSAARQIAEGRRITWIGFWVNAFLGVIKIVGGILGRSSALVADGIHSFSDFLSDIIVIVMLTVSRKSPDKSHQFGHGKFETLATLLLGVILVIVAAGIFANGINDVIKVARGTILPEPQPIAIIILIIAIVAKEWLYFATLRVGKRIHSQAVITNAWHHRSDSLSSFATLVGVAGAMLLGEHWRVLDPIAAMVVAIFIAAVGIKASAPAINELLGRSLPDDIQQKIINAVNSTDGVRNISLIRTERSGTDCIIELTVEVDPDITVGQGEEISHRVERNVTQAVLPSGAIINIHVKPFAPPAPSA